MSVTLPPDLVEEIKHNNAVAFVGAGFSAAAALPRWSDLLLGIIKSAVAEKLLSEADDATTIAQLEALIGRGTADAFDKAAQNMSDLLGASAFERLLKQQIELKAPIPAQMLARIRLLQQIPFRAILTTNYDLLLQGPTPFNPARPFREVLRPDPKRAIDRSKQEIFDIIDTVFAIDMEASEGAAGAGSSAGSGGAASTPTTTDGIDATPVATSEDGEPTPNPCEFLHKAAREALGLPEFKVPIIQVHGSVAEDNTIVCTRGGYRKLLYYAPGYQTFIQSLMSTATMVYIGFSLTDSYLNELRSGILSMLDWTGSGSDSSPRYQAPTGADPAGTSPLVRVSSIGSMSGASKRQQVFLPERVREFRERAGAYPTQAVNLRRPPIAYAILNDSSDVEMDFLRRHEGVRVLTWCSGRYSSPPAPRHLQDWNGLDRYLTAIYEATNLHHRIGKMLHGRRILMVDPYIGVDQLALYFLEVTARYVRGVRKREAAEKELADKHAAIKKPAEEADSALEVEEAKEDGAAESEPVGDLPVPTATKRTLRNDALSMKIIARNLRSMVVTSASEDDTTRKIEEMMSSDPHAVSEKHASPVVAATATAAPHVSGATVVAASSSAARSGPPIIVSPESGEVVDSATGAHLTRNASSSAMGGAGAMVEGEDSMAASSTDPTFEDPTASSYIPFADNRSCEIVIKRSVADALKVLEDKDDTAPWDVIVCNFGWKSNDKLTTAGELVNELRTRLPASKWVPLVAYGSGDFVEANRRRAIREGCFDFCYTPYGLITRMERLFHYATESDTC